MRAEKREVENEEMLVKELKSGGTNCALIRNKSLHAENLLETGFKQKAISKTSYMYILPFSCPFKRLDD